MGSSASKAARASAGAAKRQYPTRVPPTGTPSSATRPAPTQAANAGAAQTTATTTASIHEAQTSQTPHAHARAQPSGPTVHPSPYASGTRDSTIDADAFDPQLAASLRKLGPVQTAPTYSNSSVGVETTPQPSDPGVASIFPAQSSNPALLILEARRRFAEEAEKEMEQLGKSGFRGKAFVDVMLLRRALALRDDRGWSHEKIEDELGLRRGTVDKLGPKGVVGDASGGMESASG